jgi:hypothetical protein
MEPAGGSANTRPEDGDAPENLIRITAAGKERHYISYAIGLLLEKGARPVKDGEGMKKREGESIEEKERGTGERGEVRKRKMREEMWRRRTGIERKRRGKEGTPLARAPGVN